MLLETGEEGTFLVRDSSTSTGDYVLSVLYKNDVIHYQIRKHENDAFFSIGKLQYNSYSSIENETDFTLLLNFNDLR